MIKRRKSIFGLVLLLIMSLLLGACGGESTGGSGKKTFLSIGTASSAGSFYILGGGMADIWTKHLDNVEATARTTPGSSAENVPMLKKGEIEIAFLTSEQAHYGYTGEVLFDEPYEGMRAITGGHIGELQIITSADSGIKTIEDLEGKRVGSGAPGSSTESMIKAVFDEYGITDWKPVEGSNADNLEALKDGNVDAVASPLGAPTPGIVEVGATMDLHFIPIPKDRVDNIVKDHPYWFHVNIPAGTYDDLSEDYSTFAYGTVIATSEKMDEDLIYSLIKTLYEKNDELVAVHPSGSFYTIENATTSVTMPFHKGAAKYLKEQGLEVESK